MTKPFLEEVINELSDERITNLAQKIENKNFKNILILMEKGIMLKNLKFSALG